MAFLAQLHSWNSFTHFWCRWCPSDVELSQRPNSVKLSASTEKSNRVFTRGVVCLLALRECFEDFAITVLATAGNAGGYRHIAYITACTLGSRAVNAIRL